MTSTSAIMNESDIRHAVHKKLIRYHHQNSNTLVVDELGIHHGKSRIDIAVINGKLSGFEIKSDTDDLTRLPSQMKFYNSVFNQLTLVITEKHLKRSLNMISDWWGIIVATNGLRGGTYFHKIRKAKNNPEINPYALTTLLWREESVEILEAAGCSGSLLNKPKSILYKALIDKFTIEELQSTITNMLKERQNWRCHLQPL